MKKKSAKVIAITSGKGGVGKTSLSLNMGVALSQMGHKVCLFDADSNLANLNIMLKLVPEYTLEHVLKGENSIHEIVLEKHGVSIVPGASGIMDFTNLTLTKQQRLLQALTTLEDDYDYMLVDTSAGVHDQVLSFIEAAHQCLLVITAEPTSLTDAFSLLRVLKKRGFSKKVNVVVNSVNAELTARKIFSRFSGAVAKYIGYKVSYLGFVQKDQYMSKAICRQIPILVDKPSSPSSRCFWKLSLGLKKILDQTSDNLQLSTYLYKNAVSSLPDFSKQKLKTKTQQQLKLTAALSKRQMLAEHKSTIINFIDDPDLSKQEKKAVVGDIIKSYVKQFDDYPLDTVETLNHSLEMNKVSQTKIDELLSTLQLFYQDNFAKADKESSAQYLRQLINSYVEKHKSYPFDTVYALYQSLDMCAITDEQIQNLLITLNLIYQDKNLSQQHKDDANNQRIIYCAEKSNGELDRLTSLLQKKYLSRIDKKVKATAARIKNKNTDGLMDSIKYASMTERERIKSGG